MIKNNEPLEAFPYKAPSKNIIEKYEYIFSLKGSLPQRPLKFIFDKIISFFLILFSLPILLALKIAFIIEGLLIPENSGPMFFYYNAISAGKVFRKYKIRLIKTKYIDIKKAKKGEWIAYSAEWDPRTRTFVGAFVKKFYLDELPQFFNVFKGDMSIVGPRSISILHYKRDLAQGNVTRKLLKGGLLGLGHINKGTSEMGNPAYEYEYLDCYLKKTSLGLLCLDIWIIFKGIAVIFKGGGH
jgi:lipopolysaccharide/colanic/teichoic acid biosynthesis glycosyltransferase